MACPLMTEQLDDLAVLDTAAWPALLVDASACVRRANAAADDLFGGKLAGGKAPLATVWTNENGSDPAGFLDKVTAAKSLTAPLKLRGKGIAITAFTASVCTLNHDGVKTYLFQLFPVTASNGTVRGDGKTQSVEINLAQKQKLDCALQLTRTVALDFNNTLTAILGHVTHVLSVADRKSVV